MDRFTVNILNFIRTVGLIEKGDRIVAGFSGGADSTALVTVLNDIKALLGIELAAVHVNHGLRGSEASRDEAFSRDYAAGLGIQFSGVFVDTPALVKKTGMSEEEAARALRYEALLAEGRRIFPDTEGGPHGFKIAVAHHADDQAETILLNLLRGSGLKGLAGMLPARDNIIRPLLMTGRDDILLWLGSRGISYVTDSTNLENTHTRNRLRNVILPELKKDINYRAAEHIAAFGRRIYEADSYITAEARAFLDMSCGKASYDKNGRLFIKLCQSRLKEKTQIFRIYVIIEALKCLGVPMKDWGDRHFNDIDRLLFLGKGAHTDLPGQVHAENIYHETLLIKDA